MKEFMLKHPILTFMLIEDICSTIENIMLGRHKRKVGREILFESVNIGINEVKNEIRKAKTKEPIGFKFVREEA